MSARILVSRFWGLEDGPAGLDNALIQGGGARTGRRQGQNVFIFMHLVVESDLLKEQNSYHRWRGNMLRQSSGQRNVRFTGKNAENRLKLLDAK